MYGGTPRPGFPLILNTEMDPAEPFHSYLIWRLLGKGDVLEQKTWEAYGRAIWDFVKFLEANSLQWDTCCEAPGVGVVAIYRNWQITDLHLNARTINQRLNQIVNFYEWSEQRGMIANLPFNYKQVTRRGVKHDLAHVTDGKQTKDKANVFLNEWDKEPAFLTANQLRVGRNNIRSVSQRLLWDLMARVGLRSIEARTFPLKYVFNPAERKDLTPRSMVFVHLHPRDMKIKFNKPRVVAVPYSLMEDMWSYTQFERNRLSGKFSQRELILTINGKAFTNSSAGKVFFYLGRRVNFKVTPLMLRHSFAIYTLLVLRGHPQLDLEPLIYVRDRLGHESVETTMVYLRQIGRLMGDKADELMHEYDEIYGVSGSIITSTSAVSP